MKLLQTHQVPEDTVAERLSDYLVGKSLHLPSRKSVKKAIDRGLVYVDGKEAETGLWVQPGQLIEIMANDDPPPRIFTLDIPIIYEDEYLAVVNKPSGIPVSGNQFRTIQQALPGVLRPSAIPDSLRIPRPVHRLDAATSGLLLIAKTSTAAVRLGQLFERREVEKSYQAIVIGKVLGGGRFREKIHGLDAETGYESLEIVPSRRNGHLSLLQLHPLTGRTHQLRIHLSEAGHPIMGDKIYGTPGNVYLGKGLFLCATGLTFAHPFSLENMNIEIDPPNKFRLLLEREKRNFS